VAKYIVTFLLAHIDETHDIDTLGRDIKEFEKFLGYVNEKKLPENQAKVVIVEWLETKKTIDDIISEK